MQRIEQRQYENGDCGVACIAMIIDRSYEEVESVFRQLDLVKNGKYFTFHKDLISVLEYFEYEVQRKRFINWDKVSYPSIVKVNVRLGNYWHWVVKAGERMILDPKPGADEIINHYRGRNGRGQYLYIPQ